MKPSLGRLCVVMGCLAACRSDDGVARAEPDVGARAVELGFDFASDPWSHPEWSREPAVVWSKSVGAVEVGGLHALAHRPLAWLASEDDVTFILYEDGQVLFPGVAGTFEARLEQDAAARFVRAIVDRGFDRLADSYHCTAPDDSPSSAVFVRDGERWLTSGVDSVSRDDVPWCTIPDALVEAIRAMRTFRADSMWRWRPPRIAVTLWGASTRAGAPGPWPEAVPDPGADIRIPETGTVEYVVDARPADAAAAPIWTRRRFPVRVNGVDGNASLRGVLPSEEYLGRVRRCFAERRAALRRDAGVGRDVRACE